MYILFMRKVSIPYTTVAVQKNMTPMRISTIPDPARAGVYIAVHDM